MTGHEKDKGMGGKPGLTKDMTEEQDKRPDDLPEGAEDPKTKPGFDSDPIKSNKFR